jgi:hypothetical protein
MLVIGLLLMLKIYISLNNIRYKRSKKSLNNIFLAIRLIAPFISR